MTALYSKVIGAAPGVQYQGVTDNSAVPSPAASTAVIVGRFRRGPVGRIFQVTRENIRARLGEDEAGAFRVVQDILDMGVPSVSVFRIRSTMVTGAALA